MKNLLSLHPADGIDIPELEADFSPAFIDSMLELANQVLAVGTIVALVAVIVIGMVLAFGGLDARNKAKGWIALGISGAAMTVMAGATGYLTFFADVEMF